MLYEYPELIVMLTHHDYTVESAYSIFDEAKDSQAFIWGIKEKGISHEQMKELFAYMKSYGKTTALEVVAYTEKDALDGAKLAADCGCDILMGTYFFDSVNNFCKENNLHYMPFVGEISGRPSILTGNVDDIVKEAISLSQHGVYGFDLLGYRYTGDIATLNSTFIATIDLPVCLAGSITNYKELDNIKKWKPRYFTIGSAFFENKFGNTFKEQINNVYAYIRK